MVQLRSHVGCRLARGATCTGAMLCAAISLNVVSACADEGTGGPTDLYARKRTRYNVTSGYVVHNRIMDDRSHTTSAIGLGFGISRLLGRHYDIELRATLAPTVDQPGQGMILNGEAMLRLYPSMVVSQRDQFFFLFGVVIGVADPEDGDVRVVGGPEAGLGFDVFIGRETALGLELALALLFPPFEFSPALGSPPVYDNRLHNETPGGLIRATMALRFGM